MPSDHFPEGVAPLKKYLVTLTEEERPHLEQLLAKGKARIKLKKLYPTIIT